MKYVNMFAVVLCVMSGTINLLADKVGMALVMFALAALNMHFALKQST